MVCEKQRVPWDQFENKSVQALCNFNANGLFTKRWALNPDMVGENK